MKGHYYKRDCTCEIENCGCTWTFVIDIGKDPLTRERRQKSQGSFKTRQDAEIAAAELLSKINKGTYTEESCDYADIALPVAEAVVAKEFDFGILICGLNYGTVIADPNDTSPSIGASFTEVEYKSAIEVIRGYFNDINESRWTNVDKWYVKEEANEMKSFMVDKEKQEKKFGLLNIRKAQLLNWKEMPYEYAENYLPNRYMEQYENKKVFYVAVEYKVYQENEYHINGVNYFFVVLVLEDNTSLVKAVEVAIKYLYDLKYTRALNNFNGYINIEPIKEKSQN